jgi:hypothetical protein
MRSRTGYSGSPVFVYRNHADSLNWIMNKLLDQHSSMFGLLGIHCGQFKELMPITRRKAKRQNESLSNVVYEEYVEGLAGMNMVIPAERILDILALPKLLNLREKEIKMREQLR